MKALIDTNIIVDYLAERKPHAEQADKIIDLAIDKVFDGCVAAHTITNLFFILRNDMPVTERRAALLDLCETFTVVGLDSQKLVTGLENHDFKDFEDCLQDECAYDFNADYIVTRNTDDFKKGKIKAIEPAEFLKLI